MKDGIPGSTEQTTDENHSGNSWVPDFFGWLRKSPESSNKTEDETVEPLVENANQNEERIENKVSAPEEEVKVEKQNIEQPEPEPELAPASAAVEEAAAVQPQPEEETEKEAEKETEQVQAAELVMDGTKPVMYTPQYSSQPQPQPQPEQSNKHDDIRMLLRAFDTSDSNNVRPIWQAMVEKYFPILSGLDEEEVIKAMLHKNEGVIERLLGDQDGPFATEDGYPTFNKKAKIPEEVHSNMREYFASNNTNTAEQKQKLRI